VCRETIKVHTILGFNVCSSSFALAEDTSSCAVAIIGAQLLVDSSQIGPVQRRPVFCFNVRAMLQQLAGNLNLSLGAGHEDERSGAATILGVDVSSSS
jgi:hypothetical protein